MAPFGRLYLYLQRWEISGCIPGRSGLRQGRCERSTRASGEDYMIAVVCWVIILVALYTAAVVTILSDYKEN